MGCRCRSHMGMTRGVGERNPASESTIGASESTIGAASARSRTSDENFTGRDHSVRLGHANVGTIKKVQCDHCGKVFFHNADWGTFWMSRHLKECPRYRGNGFCYADAGDLTSWTFDQAHCREMLTRMIVSDGLPFSLVDSQGFRDFVSAAQPRFEHVPRFTIARDCTKLYLIEKFKLKTLLGTLRSRVALSIVRCSSMQNARYLCVNAHFIDNDWKLHKRMLDFISLPSHNGVHMGDLVEKCIQKWGLEERISTVTVDGASSNETEVNYLKDKYRCDKLFGSDEGSFHLRDGTRILNLVVNDGLNEIRDSVSRIRCAVRYVKSSPVRAQLFQSRAEKEKITSECSVCLDTSARWDSTCLMLGRAVMFRKAFERLESEDPSFSEELHRETPSSDDWQNALVFANFLEMVYDAVKKLSSISNVTSNLYFPEVASILGTLYEWTDDADLCHKSMSKKMIEVFDKYYGDIDKTNSLMLIAVVLDPRFKLELIQLFYGRIYGSETEKVGKLLANLKVELGRLFEYYYDLYLLEKTRSSQTSNSAKIAHGRGWMMLHEKLRKYSGEEAIKRAKTQLDRYLKEQLSPYEDNFEILSWWNINGERFSVLSSMARDILAIPASAAAFDAAFCELRCVLDQFHCSLTPKVLDSLVFAQDWSRLSPTCNYVEESLENAQRYESEVTFIPEHEILAE